MARPKGIDVPKAFTTGTSVRCPYCKYQYLLSEIFIPKYIFPRPKPDQIYRDEDGTILDYTGCRGNQKETYQCDNCNRFFEVTIFLRTTTRGRPDLEEDEGWYSSKI